MAVLLRGLLEWSCSTPHIGAGRRDDVCGTSSPFQSVLHEPFAFLLVWSDTENGSFQKSEVLNQTLTL